MTPPLNEVRWRPSWRLVHSRFPPVGLFDRVTDAGDLDIVLAIEGLTNDRLRQELAMLHLVPEEERIYGPGTSPIMAAFTHLSPEGSRFSDGSYGVYYAASTIHTAVAETRYHRSRFLAATREPPIEIDMRSYASNIEASFHDIRGLEEKRPELYRKAPEEYGPAQLFAKGLRDAGSNGILYHSARDPGGECVAVFRPSVLSPVTQGAHYCFAWDGEAITGVYVKTEYLG